MKPKTLLVGGLALFLGFTFLPIGINNGDVIDGYYATTSYASAVSMSQSALLSPYIEVGSIDGKSDANLAATDKLTDSTVTGWTGNLYECINADGTSTFKKPDNIGSVFANTAHISGGTHGGTDFGDGVSNMYGHKHWTLALLPGTIQKVGRDKSYGHYVVQTVDGAPGIYILYAHMANGSAWGDRVSSGPAASWQKGTDSTIQVKNGDHVDAGQRLGEVGTTGDSSGIHSHVELRYYKNADGTPKVWDIGTYPQSAGYRSNVAQVIFDNMKFSELTWVWYEKGVVYPDRHLVASDLQYMNDINLEGEVGVIEEP